MHPLSGADRATLRAVLARAGALSPAGRATMARIRLAVAARAPFSAAERAWVAPRLPALAAMPAPVFILGHWRSGTTHLYQLMVNAGFGFVPPVATGLPWDLFGLARLLRRQIEARLPEHRFIDAVKVRPDSPQEDEIALANMSPLSFYHGLYFPARLPQFVGEGVFFDGVAAADIARWRETFGYLLRKLHLYQGGRRLLIKNPVYTARLAMLAAMFPQARFLHLHRNPLDVLTSMRNFYAKLLPAFALQAHDRAVVEEVMLATYDRMMHSLYADCAALPPQRFIDLRYEDFIAAPLPTLAAAWAQLGLGDFAAHRPAFVAYLEGQRGFAFNRFARDAEAGRALAARLGHWFDRLGYPRPA